MKINPINIIFPSLRKDKNILRAVSDKKYIRELTFDSFTASEILRKQYQDENIFEDFLTKKGRVTKEEYEDIAKNNPNIIQEADKYVRSVYYGKLKPENLASIAVKTDEYLNKKYENFRIISIGTSPAALSEQLDALGNEVIYFPASGVAPISDYSYMPDIKTALAYLKYQGINSSKINLILDYTSTGATLRTVAALIKKELGIDSYKINFLPLENLLNYAFQDYPDDKSKEYFIYDTDGSLIEDLSNVPHFPVTDDAKMIYKKRKGTVLPCGKSKREIFREFDNASKPPARAFSLSVMDIIHKMKNNKQI